MYKVENMMPEDGKRVVFFWANEIGKNRTSIGYYTAGGIIECDPAADYAEVSVENEDVSHMSKGWYEDGWETDCAWIGLSENPVTHWDFLPKHPFSSV